MRSLASDAPASGQHSRITGWLLLLGSLPIVAGFVVFGPDLATLLPSTTAREMAASFYAILFLPMAVVGALFARLDKFSAFRAGQALGRWASVGLVTGVSGLMAAVCLAGLAGVLVQVQNGQASLTALAIGLGLVALQICSEEIFFRGWLFKAIESHATVPIAVICSASLFACFHLLGGTRSAISFLNIFLGGIWFALLAWRSGGLLAPMLAHFGWNASEDLIAGLSPNPGTGAFGALMNWDVVDRAPWGGADEGLNSSIAMTIVLVAFVLPLVWPPTTEPGARAPHPLGPAAG